MGTLLAALDYRCADFSAEPFRKDLQNSAVIKPCHCPTLSHPPTVAHPAASSSLEPKRCSKPEALTCCVSLAERLHDHASFILSNRCTAARVEFTASMLACSHFPVKQPHPSEETLISMRGGFHVLNTFVPANSAPYASYMSDDCLFAPHSLNSIVKLTVIANWGPSAWLRINTLDPMLQGISVIKDPFVCVQLQFRNSN
jgi:hypothetical protein